MSDLPVPKFKIGDVVFRPAFTLTTAQLPCPDCNDTKKWKAVAPSGIKHTVSCPRCSSRYFRNSQDPPALTYQRAEPHVQRLTLGSITLRSHPHNHRESIEYMAHETGIGSGGLHYEDDLCATMDEANQVAIAKAGAKNAEIELTPPYLEARHFSDLNFDAARAEFIRSVVWNATYAYNRVCASVEELLPGKDRPDAPKTLEDLHGCLREVLESESSKWNGPPPLATLLTKVRAVIDVLISDSADILDVLNAVKRLDESIAKDEKLRDLLNLLTPVKEATADVDL